MGAKEAMSNKNESVRERNNAILLKMKGNKIVEIKIKLKGVR